MIFGNEAKDAGDGVHGRLGQASAVPGGRALSGECEMIQAIRGGRQLWLVARYAVGIYGVKF